MKKTFAIIVSTAVLVLIGFACKKSSNTSTNTTTSTTGSTTSTTSTTGSTTSTNTTTTNYSVNGTVAANVAQQSQTVGSQYQISAFDGGGTSNIALTFPGATAPAAGTYTITNGTATGFHCNFILTEGSNLGAASSGTVKVTTGASNIAVFSNILCAISGTTYTVTGAIKY